MGPPPVPSPFMGVPSAVPQPLMELSWCPLQGLMDIPVEPPIPIYPTTTSSVPAGVELVVVTGINVRREMGKIGLVIGFDKRPEWNVCRTVDYELVEQNEMFKCCPELLAVEAALQTLQQNRQQVCESFWCIRMRPCTPLIANRMMERPNPNPTETDLEQFLSALCVGLPPVNWVAANLPVFSFLR